MQGLPLRATTESHDMAITTTRPEDTRRRPSKQLQQRLTRLAHAVGVVAAARRVGVHRQTYMALALGLEGNGKTIRLVEDRLAAEPDGSRGKGP